MKEKTRRIPFVLFVVLTLIALSCTDDELVSTRSESEIKVEGSRLSFPSTKSYFETILKVRYMTPDQFSEFTKKYQFASLHSLDDDVSPETEHLKRLSPAYQVILNKNGEVLIGDTIVWYAPEGTKHLIPNRDEEELSKIRKGLIPGKITEKYSQTLVATKEVDAPEGRIFWSNPGNQVAYLPLTYQYEFLSNGKKFKYVHELWNAIDGNWYRLDLVVKLEWRGASQWKTALEARFVNLSINGYAIFTPGTNLNPSITININQTQVNTLWISIKDIQRSGSGTPTWEIELAGFIAQTLTTNPNTAWNNERYPLW